MSSGVTKIESDEDTQNELVYRCSSVYSLGTLCHNVEANPVCYKHSQNVRGLNPSKSDGAPSQKSLPLLSGFSDERAILAFVALDGLLASLRIERRKSSRLFLSCIDGAIMLMKPPEKTSRTSTLLQRLAVVPGDKSRDLSQPCQPSGLVFLLVVCLVVGFATPAHAFHILF